MTWFPSAKGRENKWSVASWQSAALHPGRRRNLLKRIKKLWIENKKRQKKKREKLPNEIGESEANVPEIRRKRKKKPDDIGKRLRKSKN